jgi:Ser/Thr protein kinase RdoA (MazF antagonist)
VIDVRRAAKANVEQRLRSEFGMFVTGWSPIAGGTQNRLFRLETFGGAALLAKFYHPDRWNRLHREFSALTVLERHGLARVPRAYMRSNDFGYGVYSFEPGKPKSAVELEAGDLSAVATFAADLQGVAPSATGEDLSPAVEASFSIEQQLQVIDVRLRAFETFAGSPAAYDEVLDLCRELDLRAAISELIQRATGRLSEEERRAALPREAWRFNTTDFGPQNMLFTYDGQLTVVDFEASGWDDPARLVMGFVAHATSEDLAPGQVAMFLAAYAEARGLPGSEIARFERVGALCDLEWIAIYASALTAEVVAAKQFADSDFERPMYLARVIAKLKRRLARATEGSGYRFPAR